MCRSVSNAMKYNYKNHVWTIFWLFSLNMCVYSWFKKMLFEFLYLHSIPWFFCASLLLEDVILVIDLSHMIEINFIFFQIILSLVRFMASNKTARLGVFCYMAFLHALVFVVVYSMALTDVCKRKNIFTRFYLFRV